MEAKSFKQMIKDGEIKRAELDKAKGMGKGKVMAGTMKKAAKTEAPAEAAQAPLAANDYIPGRLQNSLALSVSNLVGSIPADALLKLVEVEAIVESGRPYDFSGEFVQVNARDLAALVMVWDQIQEARKERHEQALSKAHQEAQQEIAA